ncbi:MAG TPA: Ig-like domain-containing protein, partial [Candidatus Acidoferrales bacterium]|nr:Ig-like domain-containing protein [Candidatus Acidoferrales bacterium]
MGFSLALLAAGRVAAGTEPGTAPPNFTPRVVSAASTTGLSNQFYSATGQVYISVDAAGSNSGPANIRVNKRNATSTVRKAFLLAASTGFSGDTIADGSLLFQSTGITWDTKLASDISSENYLADVTSIVKPVVDAAAAGIVNLTVDEGSNTLAIDGEVLAVVFDDSSQTATHSVILLFGAQATTGDTFAVTLGQPIDPSAPGAFADFGLGISFSYQTNGTQQYSIVDVNGQRLSTSAGGEDDCRDATSSNGCLITAGGIGDSDANPPDPNATPTNPRSDDELYSLLPFITNSSTSISVFTQNPSEDDNIFFAYFDLSAAAVVGEGIVLAPDTATNPVGTTHTVTATVVNTLGQPVTGRTVTFSVISGPNAGASGSAATDSSGQASFTYTDSGGAGSDQIQASFVDDTDQTLTSNIVSKMWEGPTPTDTPTVTPSMTP